MKEIRLWQIDASCKGQPEVTTLDCVDHTETESLLEDILVARPELLTPELKLVGRQTDTPGGPLDLLGVDGEGRLVVFELKRGILTREAVAQIIDYGSFLSELEPAELSRHISERSGKMGIENIPDFSVWYQEQFAGNSIEPQRARLVLVGLGADDRARRMVSFLAESDVDISLVTFHAFEKQGKLYLARQVEVEARPPAGSTKVGNLAKLKDRVERLGLSALYYDVARLIQQHLPAYEWPNPSGFSYYLQDVTETGGASNRVYVSLYLQDAKPGVVQLVIHARALEAAKLSEDGLPESFPSHFDMKANGSAEVWIRPGGQWDGIRPCLADLCKAITSGWKRIRSEPARSPQSEQVTDAGNSDEATEAG